MSSVARESRKQAASRPRPPLPRPASCSLSSTARGRPRWFERVPTEVVNAQIDQVVGQGPSQKILDGEVVDVLGIRPPLAFSGREQPIDHEIPYCEADALEELMGRKGFPRLDQRVPGVALDGFPQRGRRHQEIVRNAAQSLGLQPACHARLSVPSRPRSIRPSTSETAAQRRWRTGAGPPFLESSARCTASSMSAVANGFAM